MSGDEAVVNKWDNYDVIVVGTGPGGATVARDMARRHKKVLMLEWGALNPPNGGMVQSIKELLIFFPQCSSKLFPLLNLDYRGYPFLLGPDFSLPVLMNCDIKGKTQR